MRGLVFVTQRIDRGDQVMGFTMRLIDTLALRVDRLAVVANEVRGVPSGVPANVQIVGLGRERGSGRLQRGARYVRALRRLVRDLRPEGFVAHMCPIYLDLAAPVTKSRGVVSLLWFAHPSETPALRFAEMLADGVITSLPGAYPRRSPKLHVIGQATDVGRLSFHPPPPDGKSLRLVAIGRTSPAKNFGVVIRAVALARRAGLDVRARIVGPSTNELERRTRVDLAGTISSLDLEEFVRLEPGIPPDAVADVITGADLLVNAMVAGSGDKVVFEAAALGRPSIVSNPAFEPLIAGLPMPLLFREGDDQDLAARFAEYFAAGDAKRQLVARTLRQRVEEEHSLDHWADAVVDVVGQLRGRR